MTASLAVAVAVAVCMCVQAAYRAVAGPYPRDRRRAR